MTRARQAASLLGPLSRSVVWLPLLPAGVLALAATRLGVDPVFELRLGAAALCVGAAFVLDDAAACTVAPTPSSLVFRRALRIALVLPLVAVLWSAVLLATGDVPRAAPSLELAGMLAFTLAAAAQAARYIPDGRGGLAAGPALLVGLGVAALLAPDPWTLFAAGPEDPRWAGSHLRWAGVLVVGLAALLHASLDPGRSRRPLRTLARPREPVRSADATDNA